MVLKLIIPQGDIQRCAVKRIYRLCYSDEIYSRIANGGMKQIYTPVPLQLHIMFWEKILVKQICKWMQRKMTSDFYV